MGQLVIKYEVLGADDEYLKIISIMPEAAAFGGAAQCGSLSTNGAQRLLITDCLEGVEQYLPAILKKLQSQPRHVLLKTSRGYCSKCLSDARQPNEPYGQCTHWNVLQTVQSSLSGINPDLLPTSV